LSLDTTELKIGKTTFKGAWIAVVFALASTIGGGVWTASSQQKNLLELKDEVAELSKDIESIRGIVTAAEVLTKDLGDTQKELKKINKEIDDVWDGMDYLSNPLK
jgi:peptidoglycan hydrolase CwlO-like protein